MEGFVKLNRNQCGIFITSVHKTLTQNKNKCKQKKAKIIEKNKQRKKATTKKEK